MDKARFFKTLRLATCVGLITVALTQVSAGAWTFGNGTHDDSGAPSNAPGALDQIKTIAAQTERCSNLSALRLAALMLTPTWGESGAGASDPNKAPAPMALARNDVLHYKYKDKNGNWVYYDKDSNYGLYYHPNPGNPPDPRDIQPGRRLFWHPAIGLWQLDDSYDPGTGLGMDRFWSYAAVAKMIEHDYCLNLSWEPDEAARNVFSPRWSSCGNDVCLTRLKQIYKGPPDQTNEQLIVTEDLEVDFRGGVKGTRRCTWKPTSAPRKKTKPKHFDCYFVDPAQADAQAYRGTLVPETQSPDAGWADSPLAYPYYTYTADMGGGTLREYRVWLGEFVADDPANDVVAYRTFGLSSRYEKGGGVTWRTQPAAAAGPGLCDLSKTKGHCS